MHIATHASILAKVISRTKRRSQVFEEYSKIKEVLCQEFVFLPNSDEVDFNQTIDILCNLNIVSSSNGDLLKFHDTKARNFLISLIEPFLFTYLDSWNFCVSSLARSSEDSEDLKSLCARIQKHANLNRCEGDHVFGESINLNVIQNSILYLATLNVIHVDRERKQVYCLDSSRLSDILNSFTLIIKPLISKL